MKVMIEITDEMAEALFREAMLTHGLKRKNPRIAWTDGERREFIRYAIDKRLPA